MKKEIQIVITAGLFILAYVLDYFAGPVRITVKNQIAFLAPAVLSVYPLTAVAIFSRAIALLFSVLIGLSIIKEKYFVKIIILFFLGILAELYAIQQLATSMKTTTIQWTLSIAYTGAGFVFPIVIFLILGIVNFVTHKAKLPKTEEAKTE
jgi:hypothetical protein